MAYQRAIISSIPLAAGQELSYPLVKADYHLSASIHYDDGGVTEAIVRRPCVIHHHGSGASGYMAADNAIVTRLIDQGFNVLSFRSYGAGDSSSPGPMTARQSYLNVACTSYTHAAIYGAWVHQAALEYWQTVRDTYFDSDQVMVYGHSLGSQRTIGWLAIAGTPGFWPANVVRCAWLNGLTGGGLGAGRWNQPQRVIGGLDHLLHHVQRPTELAFSDTEAYAPPDMRNRYFYSQAANPNIRIWSPNSVSSIYTGHSWQTGTQGSLLAAARMRALWDSVPPETPVIP